MSKEEFLELCDKYASGLATPQEIKAVETFYYRLQQRPVGLPWDLTTEEQVRLRILAKILNKIPAGAERPISYRRYLNIAASIMAITCATLLLLFLFKQKDRVEMITHTTLAQQRTILTLDDSSVVYLNFGSSLTLPERFSSRERKVLLNGEAYFRIAHDPNRPFIVETNQLTTRVLGTQFNVRAYATAPAEVTVFTGRVKVAAAGAEVMLTANQQAVQEHPGTVPEVRTVDAAVLCAWRNNTLEFDMVPFNEVIHRLGRWYHVEMNLQTFTKSECMVHAKFSNQGLVNVLEGLRHLVNFEYETIQENKINIIYRGCKD